MQIGSWVRRHRKRAKWHRVESLIEGEPITRCGRRLPATIGNGETKTRPGLEVTEVAPLTRMIGQPQLCRYCG